MEITQLPITPGLGIEMDEEYLVGHAATAVTAYGGVQSVWERR